MISPISILWTFLSVMVTCTCCFSFSQPFWFVHKDNSFSLGMYSYCQRQNEHDFHFRICQTYTGTFDLYDLATGAWQAACILYGGGCALLVVSSILSICAMCLKNDMGEKLGTVASYLQIVSVVLMVAALVIYPFGLASPFVKTLCGETSAFFGANCQLGWSYMLGIMGTSLSVFCPIFSHLKDANEPTMPSHSPSVATTILSHNTHRTLSRSFSMYKYPHPIEII